MKTTWRSFWITALLLAAFVAAGIFTPETPATRAEHARAAAACQQKQINKGAAHPDVKYRAPWKDSGWARGLQEWDHAAFKTVNTGWDNRFFDAVMPAVTNLGTGHWQAILLIVLWFLARRAKRRDWQRTAALGLVGVVVGIAAPILKKIVPRYRPATLYPYDIVLLVRNTGLWALHVGKFQVFAVTPLYGGSFPSGHTLTSFTIATIIAMRHRWAGPPALALAAIISLSRISVGAHWPLDALASAVLGVLLGWAVARWGREKTEETP